MGFEWIPIKNYKRHYICLDCQKGFKRPSEKDMKNSESTDFSNLMNEYYATEAKQDIVKYIQKTYEKIKVVCPNCQNNMLQVPYTFEVPKQQDKKSWKTIQETWSSKTIINYNSYIHWHQLELQKITPNSTTHKLLTQNIEKLKSIVSVE